MNSFPCIRIDFFGYAVVEIKKIKKNFPLSFVTFTFTFDSDTTFFSGIHFFIAV